MHDNHHSGHGKAAHPGKYECADCGHTIIHQDAEAPLPQCPFSRDGKHGKQSWKCIDKVSATKEERRTPGAGVPD